MELGQTTLFVVKLRFVRQTSHFELFLIDAIIGLHHTWNWLCRTCLSFLCWRCLLLLWLRVVAWWSLMWHWLLRACLRLCHWLFINFRNDLLSVWFNSCFICCRASLWIWLWLACQSASISVSGRNILWSVALANGLWVININNAHMRIDDVLVTLVSSKVGWIVFILIFNSFGRRVATSTLLLAYNVPLFLGIFFCLQLHFLCFHLFVIFFFLFWVDFLTQEPGCICFCLVLELTKFHFFVFTATFGLLFVFHGLMLSTYEAAFFRCLIVACSSYHVSVIWGLAHLKWCALCISKSSWIHRSRKINAHVINCGVWSNGALKFLAR